MSAKKKLVINDAKIKKAYEARKQNGINKKELMEIIECAKDRDSDEGHYAKTISKSEAKDIHNIVKHGNVSSAAREWFQDYVAKKSRRSSTRLVNEQKTLDGIAAILRDPSNSKFFNSPKYPLQYSPGRYSVVGDAIADRYIEIWELEVENYAMAAPGMTYSSDGNRLSIPKPFKTNDSRWIALLVHEATHAIQDICDVSMTVQCYEADAYIAQVTCMLLRNAAVKGDFHEKFLPAARLVLNGKSLTDKGTKPEYVAAMKAVADHPLYSEKAKSGKAKSFDESIVQEAIEEMFAQNKESNYQAKMKKK